MRSPKPIEWFPLRNATNPLRKSILGTLSLERLTHDPAFIDSMQRLLPVKVTRSCFSAKWFRSRSIRDPDRVVWWLTCPMLGALIQIGSMSSTLNPTLWRISGCAVKSIYWGKTTAFTFAIQSIGISRTEACWLVVPDANRELLRVRVRQSRSLV